MHQEKNWKYCSVKRLVAWYKKTGTLERKKGSGRPRTARNEENEETVEELIMSQEDEPHSHLAPRQIEESEGISRSPVVRIVRDIEINNFKLSKMPAMTKALENAVWNAP